MVMSWLINSTTNEIGENFLLYETAQEIRDAARETHSSSDNVAELFGIESTLYELKQGEITVTQQKRIFKFLLGLNPNLDEVRGRILGTKPLPSIRAVFSEVRREESRKKVMLGNPNPEYKLDILVPENSALIARRNQYNVTDNQPRKGRP